MAAPHLTLIPDMDANETGRAAISNDKSAGLDRAMNGDATVDLTAGGTIALTDEQTQENGTLEFIGTPGAGVTVTMPDLNKRFLRLLNNCGQTVTVENSTTDAGSPIIMLDAKAALAQYTGTDFKTLFLG